MHFEGVTLHLGILIYLHIITGTFFHVAHVDHASSTSWPHQIENRYTFKRHVAFWISSENVCLYCDI